MAVQSTPKPKDAVGPIRRPGRYDHKVALLASNKNTAGNLFIVGGGAAYDSDLAVAAAVLKAEKAQEKTNATKEKKKSARKALCAEVAVIRAAELPDDQLSGTQLSALLRYKMPKGGASRFTLKIAMLAQYAKVKGDESEEEEEDAVVVAPAVAPVPPPSPGANWKRVDVGLLTGADLDRHILMLLQEKNRRELGVA